MNVKTFMALVADKTIASVTKDLTNNTKQGSESPNRKEWMINHPTKLF